MASTTSGRPSRSTSPSATATARTRRDGRVLFAAESAPAVAEENRDGLLREVRRDEIAPAVAVEVRQAKIPIRPAARLDRGPGRREPALSVAAQEREPLLSPAVDHQVEDAVAVGVARGDRVRVRAAPDRQRRAGSGPEAAAAVSQQDRDERRAVIGDREVEIPVAVEVGGRDLHRLAPRGDIAPAPC